MGPFESILTNIKQAKEEGKITGGYRFKNDGLKVGGGYYDDNKMIEIEVGKDNANVLFKKRFADGGSTNPYLDQKQFIKEFTKQRLNGDMNGPNFVEHLNKNYSTSAQTDVFNKDNVDRRLRRLQEKGSIPKNLIYKGSKLEKKLTPEKYISLLGEEEYSKLKDNPKKLKYRYEYLRDIKNRPNFLKIRSDRTLAKTRAMGDIEYEDKILEPARERAAKARGSLAKFTVNRKNSKSMMWKDLISRTHATKGEPYFTFEKPIESKKIYNAEEIKKIVLKDKKGNKFKFDTLFKDIEKVTGKEGFKSFQNTYDQRAFMNKDGITTELNKVYGNKPGSMKSVFNIQHIEGFNKNPFKVHMTFGDQNLNEAYSRRSFTSDFGKADTYSKRKAAVNKYYKSLGPDIVAQIGKQPKGKAKPLIELLNKAKINLQPDIKAKAISLGSFPAQLAEAPGMTKTAVKSIAKSVGKVLGVAAIPLEAYFMKQMYDEGKTMSEILSSPLMLEGMVGGSQDLLKMKPVERQAISNEQILQDESYLDTDFYQPELEGLQSVDTQMVKDRIARERAAEEAKRASERNKPKQGFTFGNNYGIRSFDQEV